MEKHLFQKLISKFGFVFMDGESYARMEVVTSTTPDQEYRYNCKVMDTVGIEFIAEWSHRNLHPGHKLNFNIPDSMRAVEELDISRCPVEYLSDKQSYSRFKDNFGTTYEFASEHAFTELPTVEGPEMARYYTAILIRKSDYMYCRGYWPVMGAGGVKNVEFDIVCEVKEL